MPGSGAAVDWTGGACILGLANPPPREPTGIGAIAAGFETASGRDWG
jgi:hypothetical protein